MIKKLFAFARGECAAESADSPANQELLLGGHLYLAFLKAWTYSFKFFWCNLFLLWNKKVDHNEACIHL